MTTIAAIAAIIAALCSAATLFVVLAIAWDEIFYRMYGERDR